MLSIIVPAHDEERLIGATLEALHAAATGAGVPYEIIVADDASTDRTAAIAAGGGARVVPVSCRHIAATRNAGARASGGAFLMFVDADTLVSRQVIEAAVGAMRAGALGGGARHVQFDGQMPRYAQGLVWATLTFFQVTNMTFGCFMFATREAFDAIGGFDESLFAAEEVAFSRAIRDRGRFVLVRPPVTTSGRKFRTFTIAELLRMASGAIVIGRGALKSRKALALWYGARRDDPS